MKEESKKPLIVICIPIWDSVSGCFFTKFMEIANTLFYNSIQPEGKYNFTILCSHHQFLCQARNDLVEKALKNGATHILFLDSDSIIEPYFIVKMLEDNVDIVSAITFGKNPPHKPVVYYKEEDWFQCKVDIEFNKGLVEIDGVGFGCTMIKKEVFEKINKPYFLLEKETIENISVYQGEDLVFSDRAKQEGFKMYVDTDLIYYHYGGLVGLNNYSVYRDDVILLEKEKKKLLEDITNFFGWTKKEAMNTMVTLPNRLSFEGKTLFEQFDWYITKYRSTCYDITDEIEQMCKRYGELRILDLDECLGQIGYILAEKGYNINMLIGNEKKIPSFVKYRIGVNKLEIKLWRFEKLLNDYFHIVIANDIFEHLDNRELEDYLRTIKRILKKGGRLLSKTIEHSERHLNHYKWTKERQEMVKEILKGGEKSV